MIETNTDNIAADVVELTLQTGVWVNKDTPLLCSFSYTFSSDFQIEHSSPIRRIVFSNHKVRVD